MRCLRPLVAALLLAGAMGCGEPAPTPVSEPPSIVLITVDTLRADHLGVYGYARDTSPEIDRFAESALVFENAISSAPETRASFASLFTGFLPHETGVLDVRFLPQAVDTLAERLRERGFRTLAVSSNHLLKGEWGWSQGFDVYDEEMPDQEAVRRLPERIAEHTTDRAIQLLERHHGERIFLWVHYQDPHGPYTPPDDVAGRFDDPTREPRPLVQNAKIHGRGGIPSYQRLGDQRDFHHYVARYDAEIFYLDRELGRLLDALRTHGLYDEALIVLTADHGEGMGEKDYYFAHLEQIFHGLLHVPLIVKHGDRLVGRRSDFVSLVDVLPTVLAAVGAEDGRDLPGRDLRARGEESREIYSEQMSGTPKRRALLVGGLKLVHAPEFDRTELYDVRVDPREERDLSGTPEGRRETQRLLERMREIRETDRLEIVRPGQLELSEEELEQLRRLGYTH